AWVADVTRDGDFPRAAVAAREGLHGAFGSPVLVGPRVRGVIEFFSHEIREPDADLLAMMANVGSQVGQFSERRRAEGALHARAKEFSLARTIQQGLLPKAPPTLAGFDLAGVSSPAQETGGDYFDFIPMAQDSWGIAVGDVSGHGIGAALLMAETRAYL